LVAHDRSPECAGHGVKRPRGREMHRAYHSRAKRRAGAPIVRGPDDRACGRRHDDSTCAAHESRSPARDGLRAREWYKSEGRAFVHPMIPRLALRSLPTDCAPAPGGTCDAATMLRGRVRLPSAAGGSR
jgi:hypothetical protein